MYLRSLKDVTKSHLFLDPSERSLRCLSQWRSDQRHLMPAGHTLFNLVDIQVIQETLLIIFSVMSSQKT